jgi:nucleoside-diphosphate-sugar epimerase
MLEVAGSSLQPIHARADWTAGSHRVSDNTAAQRILGWSPSVALRDGLAGVYTWLRNR